MLKYQLCGELVLVWTYHLCKSIGDFGNLFKAGFVNHVKYQ